MLIKLTNPKLFFNILPTDWQQLIVPYWENYKNTANIYVFKEKKNVIAGGIIFTKDHPHKNDFEKSVDYLYKEDYHYIGYVWVIPTKRNQQLASKWLTELKLLNPLQKYWLTIEDEALKYFYKKNGFKLIKQSIATDLKEWLLIYP